METNGDDSVDRSRSAGDPETGDPATAVARAAAVGLDLSVAAARRYAPLYLYALGGSPAAVGLYGSVDALVGIAYARVRTRFPGTTSRWLPPTVLSSLGAFLWLVAPQLHLRLVDVRIPAWVWVFVGSTLVRTWESRALARASTGATAVANRRPSGGRSAASAAAAKTTERVVSLVGFLLSAGLLAAVGGFVPGFQVVAAFVAAVGLTVAVVGRVLGVRAGGDAARAAGSDESSTDDESRLLVAGDASVRFADGMTSVFVVLVVATVLRPDATVVGHHLRPAAFFGVLLAVEAAVAVLGLRPGAAVARRLGPAPLVVGSLFVSAAFPVVLVTAPPNASALALVFAFSGLRLVGLPARETLLRGPTADDSDRAGGTVPSSSNAIAVPSATLGGVAYGVDPRFAFGLATAIGLLGVWAFSRSLGERRTCDSPRQR